MSKCTKVEMDSAYNHSNLSLGTKPISFIVFAIFLLFSMQSAAQSYVTSAGFRIGTDFGITVVQRIAKHNTIELLYEDGLFEKNRNLSLMVKQHMPLISKRINFYTGIGLGYYGSLDESGKTQHNSASIPFILGAEMSIGRLNFGLDFQPTILFNTFDTKRFVRTSGVSVRYILVEQKKKTVKDVFNNIFKKKQKNEKSRKK